jgi:hypothetical protein
MVLLVALAVAVAVVIVVPYLVVLVRLVRVAAAELALVTLVPDLVVVAVVAFLPLGGQVHSGKGAMVVMGTSCLGIILDMLVVVLGQV